MALSSAEYGHVLRMHCTDRAFSENKCGTNSLIVQTPGSYNGSHGHAQTTWSLCHVFCDRSCRVCQVSTGLGLYAASLSLVPLSIRRNGSMGSQDVTKCECVPESNHSIVAAASSKVLHGS